MVSPFLIVPSGTERTVNFWFWRRSSVAGVGCPLTTSVAFEFIDDDFA